MIYGCFGEYPHSALFCDFVRLWWQLKVLLMATVKEQCVLLPN